ncbi:hypothetical protein PENTCL1PPCAC_27760 [Pristionchus entomophagus]|uniref:G protein-coupled receptor n=1 Tax=Pristionchus entomophagus TaxID=358040 RepID=A0AAV5UGK0_9BILA|nr:hypothetical protein PENTCL1PPCAC_27760 [Pristionchus entomophagus]
MTLACYTWASETLDSDRRTKSIKFIRLEMLAHYLLTLLTLIGWNIPLLIVNVVVDVFNLWWWFTSQFNDNKKIYYRLSCQCLVFFLFMFFNLFYLLYYIHIHYPRPA